MATLKRKYVNFTKEDDETIINLIKERPAIFDLTNANYKNHIHRNTMWLEIATILERPVDECKTRWRTLRDTFKKKSKSTDTSVEKWEYYDIISSMIDNTDPLGSNVNIISGTSLHTNLESSGIFKENSKNVEETHSVQNVKHTTDDCIETQQIHISPSLTLLYQCPGKLNKDETSIIQHVSPTVQEHAVELLFKGLARTVMTFPPGLAAEAKFRVCQVVSELEYRLHNVTAESPSCSNYSFYGNTNTSVKNEIDDDLKLF